VDPTVGLPADRAAHGVGDAQAQGPVLLTVPNSQQMLESPYCTVEHDLSKVCKKY